MLGYDKNELEAALQKLGYERGSRVRNSCYDILEVRSYDVNEHNFPVILIEVINKLDPKNNILIYNLTLDLNCIEYEKIM